MREIIFNSRSRKDLIELWDYIARDNIDAADEMVRRIETEITKLAAMPEIGHPRQDVNDIGLLFWVVRPYVIAYRHTRKTLHINRVLHGARDFRKLFPKRP